MSITTIFDKMKAEAGTLLKEGETDLLKLFSKVEPAAVSFLKQVSHDFLVDWMPTALKLVTDLLASGNGITTATIGQMASQLEATALASGKQVLAQDAITTVQMAVAHVQQAVAASSAPKAQ